MITASQNSSPDQVSSPPRKRAGRRERKQGEALGAGGEWMLTSAGMLAGHFSGPAIAAAKEGIIGYGPDLTYQVWNPVMEQLTGVPAAAVLGRPPVEVFPSLQAAGLMARLAEVMQGKVSAPVEYFYQIPQTGRSVWVADSCAPLQEATGKIIGVMAVVRDISERKISEVLLEESEPQFRQLAEHVQEVYWMLDARTARPLYISPAYEKVWGRTCQSRYEHPESWLEAVHPEDRERVARAFQQISLRQGFHEEYRIVLPDDGSIRWIGDRGITVSDPDSNGERIVGVARDITLRKQAQEKLQASEERYRYLVEHAPVAIFIGFENRFAYLNPAALKLFEAQQPEQLLGKSIVEMVHPDHKSHFAQSFASQNLAPAIQAKFIRLDGVAVDVEVAAVPVRWGGEPGFQLFVHDVTPRKRAEDALRVSDYAIKAVSQGVLITDADRRILSVNTAFEAITGYREAEVLGRRSSFLVGPLTDLQTVDTMRNALKNMREFSGELLNYRKDGTPFWNDLTLSPVRDAQGQLSHFIGIIRDITARKQVLEALRKNEQDLEDFFTEAPLGLFWAAPDGRIVRINQAELKLLHCQLEEVLGQPVSKFFVDAKVINNIHSRLARRETIHNCRARIRQKDGVIRHVLVDANGLWEKDRLVHTRWFVRDITRRLELEQEILSISEREQRRLGQDLHDDLCQQLAGIEFLSQTLFSGLAAKSHPKAAQAREIAQMVRSAMNKTRELAQGLSPVRLEEEGLMNGLRELAERIRTIFQVDCRFKCKIPLRVTDETVSIHLYRIAQEAVSNAIKHGKARRIEISLAAEPAGLILQVSNDGAALPRKKSAQKGMGMRIMQYRAGIIGGDLIVQRNATKGVTLTCTVNKGLTAASGKE